MKYDHYMKIVIYVLTFVFSVSCALIDNRPIQKPYLWKVEKGGKINHVFASIAVALEEKDIPPKVLETLENSSYFMWEGENAHKKTSWLKKAFKENKRSAVVQRWIENCLRESENDHRCSTYYLEGERRKKLDDLLNRFYSDKELLNRAALFPFVFGGIPAPLLDLELRRIAKENSIPIVELDANQKYWDEIGYKATKNMIKMFYKHEEQLFKGNTLYFRRQIAKNNFLYQSYLTGDFPFSVREELRESEIYSDNKFLIKRNLAWDEFFFHLLDRGNVFLVAHMAHLEGESGVFEILRKKGFKISRIN